MNAKQYCKLKELRLNINMAIEDYKNYCLQLEKEAEGMKIETIRYCLDCKKELPKGEYSSACCEKKLGAMQVENFDCDYCCVKEYKRKK